MEKGANVCKLSDLDTHKIIKGRKTQNAEYNDL